MLNITRATTHILRVRDMYPQEQNVEGTIEGIWTHENSDS